MWETPDGRRRPLGYSAHTKSLRDSAGLAASQPQPIARERVSDRTLSTGLEFRDTDARDKCDLGTSELLQEVRKFSPYYRR
jgi:hypothetical protein